MPHTLANNLVHCVFSTKDRRDLIPDIEKVWRYITGIAHAVKVPLLGIGGTANHVHLLLALPPAVSLAEVMRKLKGNSSRWINEHEAGFAWQEGYGAFSVSSSQKQVVLRYIHSQQEHHKKWTFEQELTTLLQKSEVEYDRRYIFG